MRDQIGDFIAQGNALLAAICNKDNDFGQVTNESNGWANEVEDFLRTKLGDSYVLRFRNAANLPLGEPVGIGQQRLSYWRGVRARVLNLDRFSGELPH